MKTLLDAEDILELSHKQKLAESITPRSSLDEISVAEKLYEERRLENYRWRKHFDSKESSKKGPSESTKVELGLLTKAAKSADDIERYTIYLLCAKSK